MQRQLSQQTPDTMLTGCRLSITEIKNRKTCGSLRCRNTLCSPASTRDVKVYRFKCWLSLLMDYRRCPFLTGLPASSHATIASPSQIICAAPVSLSSCTTISRSAKVLEDERAGEERVIVLISTLRPSLSTCIKPSVRSILQMQPQGMGRMDLT